MNSSNTFAPGNAGWLEDLCASFASASRRPGWRPRSCWRRSIRPSRAVLLVIYPAWDAVANLVDAQRNGGTRAQCVASAQRRGVSAITTIAVVVALGQGMAAVVFVFGVWAVLSGLLQLVTAVRRWASGGLWAMVLSGAQSALAGGFFVFSAGTMPNPGIALIAGLCRLRRRIFPRDRGLAQRTRGQGSRLSRSVSRS